MKSKKFNKKLNLSKITIAQLNKGDMINIEAGDWGDTTMFNCISCLGIRCQSIGCYTIDCGGGTYGGGGEDPYCIQ